MTKQEKNEVIEVLKSKFSQYNNFYITDTESLTVAQVGKLRSHCFNKQVEMKVAKNTLIEKALERSDKDYSGLVDTLKGNTALMFATDSKTPAKIIKAFRKKDTIPALKGAYIDSDIFLGDTSLEALVALKSKNELIGEVIGLLQSPAKNVIGALQSSGDKLAGIVKTLSERPE